METNNTSLSREQKRERAKFFNKDKRVVSVKVDKQSYINSFKSYLDFYLGESTSFKLEDGRTVRECV